MNSEEVEIIAKKALVEAYSNGMDEGLGIILEVINEIQIYQDTSPLMLELAKSIKRIRKKQKQMITEAYSIIDQNEQEDSVESIIEKAKDIVFY